MNDTAFLQIKSAELANLYDCLPDVWFWVKDINSKFLWGNTSFISNFGLKQVEDLIGKTDFDFSPYYLAEHFVTDDKAVLEGKKVENRIELVNGTRNHINWCVTTKRSILNENGIVIGTMGISRKLTDKQNPEIPISKLNEIVKYIHSNIHQAINIRDMAKIMNCAVSTLERIFRKQLHASPLEFIRMIKMQYACNYLLTSNLTIFDIAYSLGYADQSHFIREFKRSFQLTPLQYRKHNLKI